MWWVGGSVRRLGGKAETHVIVAVPEQKSSISEDLAFSFDQFPSAVSLPFHASPFTIAPSFIPERHERVVHLRHLKVPQSHSAQKKHPNPSHLRGRRGGPPRPAHPSSGNRGIMRISISIISADVELQSDFISLDVGPDMTFNDIKGFVEAEINLPPTSHQFLRNGQPVLDPSKTLGQMQVEEGDVIALALRTRPSQDHAPNPAPSRSAPQPRARHDPEQLRLRLLGDAALMADCRQQDPELAAAASSAQQFHDLFNARQDHHQRMQRDKEEQIARLEADPFNAEAQQKIEEMIRQERVAENLQKAMEENPESFGKVTMLYIDVTVNNVPIKAFVDSGAQTTIMSPEAAERCGILRLIDKRFGGMARGVGTAEILGRVHSADIQIGQYSLASSFTVMVGKDVDLLLGLDMLKRHQMCIDLRKHCLRVQDDEIAFLPESEIPKMMEEILENEPKVKGPGGTTIGATTGTLQSASASGPQQGPVATTKETATPSSSSRAQPPASSSNFGQSQPITAESIAKITELGFTREEAIAALRQVDGNVELAIGLLI